MLLGLKKLVERVTGVHRLDRLDDRKARVLERLDHDPGVGGMKADDDFLAVVLLRIDVLRLADRIDGLHFRSAASTMSVMRPIIPGLRSSGARVTPLRFSQAPRKWAASEKISLAEIMPTTWPCSITGNCPMPSSWPRCRACSMVSLASTVAGLRTIMSLTLMRVE
jgi:hypothetical protein